MGNPLKTILIEYENILKDYKRFANLLADYFPQNKIYRNLILICVNEKVPEEILLLKKVEAKDVYRLKNILINASGCNEEIASEVICLWVEALCSDEQEEQIACIHEKAGNTLHESKNDDKEIYSKPLSELNIDKNVIESIMSHTKCRVVNDLWKLSPKEICLDLGLNYNQIDELLIALEEIKTRNLHTHHIEQCRIAMKRYRNYILD